MTEFKPGSYKQGDQVTSGGFTWQAKRDIGYASALPKENTYWTKVETGKNFIQAQIDAVPEYGRKAIKIPDGKYYFNEPIKWHNKGIWLIGDADVTLYFKEGIAGIIATRSNSSAGKSYISNMTIRSQGNKVNSKVHGVEIRTITKLENVIVQNFGLNGFNFFGAVEQGTDVSGSSLYDCAAAECGGDGLRIQGPDANQVNTYNFDARDNDGYGIGDFGFLGSQHFGPMFHYNKKGDYISADANARSGFFGPYCEGGNPPSELNGTSNTWGGIHESGLKISRYSSAQLGAHSYNHDYGWKQINREQETINEFFIRPDGKGNVEFNMGNSGADFKMFQRGGQFTPQSELEMWDDITRKPNFSGIAFKHIFIGNRFITFARSVDDLKKWGNTYNEFEFAKGDKIFNSNYDGNNEEGWTCIQGGKLAVSKWKANV